MVNTDNIPQIAAHVNDAKNSFIYNSDYSSLRISQIQINEFGGSWNHMNPGALLAYYYLERAKVDYAARTCWNTEPGGKNNCYNALDGLVSASFRAKRPGWWVNKFYADGVAYRVETQSDLPHVVALASSRSDSAAKAQIIVSYYGKYGQESSSMQNLSLGVANLDVLGFAGGNNAHVHVRELPDTQTDPLPAPDAAVDQTAVVKNRSAVFSLRNLKLNSVYVLTLSLN